ncbi:hypothetical protein [Algoriphagus mannitolivorans]|uniref:hypothetical protein n=1 Tax=Algoriphagus mannitolivorans TaxID=226504 RepID=UPI00068860A8|nr:hypothetical protein [Algoriphagus mannitolivorans]
MKAYKKTIGDSYTLAVIPDPKEDSGDFFMDSRSSEFPRQLEFQFGKNGKPRVSLLIAISNENHAISLPYAPFGGIWSKENVSSEILEDFIREVIDYLKGIGIESLEIIQPPKPYVFQSDLINNLMLKSGFELRKVLSHQFFLGKKKIKRLVQEQSSKIHRKEKESGIKIRAGAIQNFKFLDEIRTWNSSRGYEVTFEEKRLISQVSEFPEKYFLISLSQGEREIAHSLVVKLTSDSLYYFLSAMDPKSSVKSLGDILVFSLFQLASEQKIELIDLGSSETHHRINHSLMYFKSRFSNDISNKISWYRKIEK